MPDVSAVPGIETVHPRSSWVDPRYPVTGPVAPWSTIDTAAIHYTAADNLIDGDPGEHAENLPAYIRAMQKAYVDQRGYSLGYWWAVDWLGGVWQIRGWEIKSAANAGHNEHTGPILVLVDGNDPATDLAARSIRCLIAEGQRLARDTWAIKGHGQLRRETGIGTPTACCGIGLQAQIDAGVFVPRTEPPPDPGDDDMAAAWIALPPPERPGGPHLVIQGAAARYAVSEDGQDYPDRRVIKDPVQYDNLVKSI